VPGLVWANSFREVPDRCIMSQKEELMAYVAMGMTLPACLFSLETFAMGCMFFSPIIILSIFEHRKSIWYTLKNILPMVNKKYQFKILAKELLATLKTCHIIYPYAKLKLNVKNTDFYLENADAKENAIFRQAFYELISPIDSPRYVITNGEKVYQVPTILGKNKDNVQMLHKIIFGKLPRGILYTKTQESKELLLKIKMFQEKTLESNIKMDILDKDIISEIENNKVNIESTTIDINIMKDVLESKNLIEEE
jgi:hypothetical protein